MDWSNVFVAGGSVLACLMPVSAISDLIQFYHYQAYPFNDIDLFIYGLTVKEANEKIKQIYKQIVNTTPSSFAVRSGRTITIVSGFPRRHVQIVLRLYKSPAGIFYLFVLSVSVFVFVFICFVFICFVFPTFRYRNSDGI
jgi:hypothetical protein